MFLPQGVLDLDRILEAIYSEEVTVPIDVMAGLGDVTAFTVAVFTFMLYDPHTVQVVPAALLFLGLAWVGSIYNAYHDICQIYSMWLMHHHKGVFMTQLAEKLAHQTVKSVTKSVAASSNAGSPARSPPRSPNHTM